jgi:transcriptional regulator with XRE-family HTH domain
MKTFGQFLREAREEKDVSLRELAKEIDCSPAFLSDIELGKRNPSEGVLAKIAKYLSTPIDEFKKYDMRIPAEEIRQSSITDPQLMYAFRTILDKNIKSEDLIKFAKGYSQKKSNKKK